MAHLTRSLALILAASAALLLPACGGGGGSSGGGDEETRDIVVTRAGMTDGATLDSSSPRIYVGDGEDDESLRGLLQFALSDIPAGATVTGATLRLEFEGHFGSLGGFTPLITERYEPTSSALAAADHDAPTATHDPDSNLLLIPEDTDFAIGVREIVKAAHDAGDTHVWIRMRLQTESDNDGAEDGFEFASNDHLTLAHPLLRVVYELP